MTTSDDVESEQRYRWQYPVRPRRSAQDTAVDGPVLAALRRGINREPGTVPEMWPFYRELNDRGEITRELRAEHITLTLFAVHQQSKPTSVHRYGVGVGQAMAALRISSKFSTEAVERRFAAFATATSLAEAATHLRGLITQLRTIDQGLDYTQLMHDLVRWQRPESAGAVRRRWGMQFFIAPQKSGTPDKKTQES